MSAGHPQFFRAGEDHVIYDMVLIRGITAPKRTKIMTPICRPAARILAAAGFLCPALPVCADVTIQGRQTVRAGTAVPTTVGASLSCQGANTRLEIAGAPTLIYDGKANILYGVNPVRRSYYLSVPAPTDPADEVSLTADEVKIETKLDLHGTGRTRIFAGLAAHEYSLNGTVIYTQLHPGRVHAENEQADERERESRQKRMAAYLPPQWSIRGEIWLADTVKFPAAENSLPAVLLTAVSAGPFGEPLADAFEKRSGLPLFSQITVTHAPPVPSAPATTTQTTWSAQSVSDAQLDPAQFKPPLNYALVAAPP